MLVMFMELRRNREEMLETIPVLERADGSVWAYDDAAYVAAFQALAPNANITVSVIGKDPQ